MTQKMINKIKQFHTQKISSMKDGRWRTTVWDTVEKKQKYIYSTGNDINTLYEKLYEHYFPKKVTLKDIFYEYCDYTLSITPEEKRLKNKGQKVTDLFSMIDYNNRSEYPYKDAKEHDFYNEEERAKVLIYLDSLEHPTLNQLLIEVIFELSLRLGEAIALRYDDFVFEVDDDNNIISGKVFIRGKATGRIREERTKCNSDRVLEVKPRLVTILKKIRKLSWSD